MGKRVLVAIVLFFAITFIQTCLTYEKPDTIEDHYCSDYIESSEGLEIKGEDDILIIDSCAFCGKNYYYYNGIQIDIEEALSLIEYRCSQLEW